MEDGSLIEVGTIGREGTTAIPLIMGANTTANESFCQVEGRAWEIPAKGVRHLTRGEPRFPRGDEPLLASLRQYVGSDGRMQRLA